MIFLETPVSDGTHIILGMLIVGLFFLAVIGVGELVRAAGHRKNAHKHY